MKTDLYMIKRVVIQGKSIDIFSFVQFDSMRPRQCPEKDQIIFILK
jgi:hypothetical protein